MNKPVNKIEKLIAELCLEGVEVKDLWELTAWDKRFNGIEREKQKRIVVYPYVLANRFREIAQPSGDVRLLSTGNYIGWTTEELAGRNLCVGEIVAIPWGGQANIKYYKGKFVTADNRIATSLDTNVLSNKYLYYWMLENNQLIESFYRGSGIKHPSMRKVLEMKIPLPPLIIQEEIVKILNSFTELEAELEAEIEARKKQYGYYREELLTFGEGVEFKSIDEICQINRGRVMSKDYLRNNAGEYPVYSSQTVDDGVFGRINTYDYDGEYLTWTTDGANAGSIFYRNGKFSITNVCGLLKVKVDGVNTKFLSYILAIVSKKYVSAGMGNPKIMSNVMEKIKIPIPTLAEQERIVIILDKFDALTNDISVGLPAELKARRKQYKYYRDKLLTFKPLEKEYAKQ